MAHLGTSALKCLVLASFLVIPWVGVDASIQVDGIPGYHVTDSDGDTIYNVNAPYSEEFDTTILDIPEAEDDIIEIDSDAEVELPPRVNSYGTPNTHESNPTPYSTRPQPQPQPQPVRPQPQPTPQRHQGHHTDRNKNTQGHASEPTPTPARQRTPSKTSVENHVPSVFRDVFGRPLYQRRREPSPTYNNNNRHHHNNNNGGSTGAVDGVGTPVPQRFRPRSERRRQENPWSQLEQFSPPSMMNRGNRLFQDSSDKFSNRVNPFNLMMMNSFSPFGRLSDSSFNRFPLLNQNHMPMMIRSQPQHCNYY